MIKVLNLYAGIGGNRKLWQQAHTNEFEITAVENNPEIATIYSNYFPEDKLIIGDAHQYLLEHYKEFDFIWSSPPCQTHSSFRHNICVKLRGTKPEYPDMRLYQEILFLKHHFEGKWVVENVKPYYDFFIKPSQILQRHCFWANYDINFMEFKKDNLRKAQIPDLEKAYGYDLSKFKISNKRQVLRNCVQPELGHYVFVEGLIK